MEICSRCQSSDSSGAYEMTVGSLLDQLRKSHSMSSSSSSPTSPTTYASSDIIMKKNITTNTSNTEIGGDEQYIKKTTPTPCLPSNSSHSPTHHQNSTNLISKYDLCNSSKKSTGCEIFLGGSCNPTSWRRDIAIPILSHSGISFFNPQVSSWCPELIAAEHEAKELAKFLFFVIDSETRAIAAMVEVAYLIAQGKNVVLVITGNPQSGHVIFGEILSDKEVKVLTEGHNLLRQLSSKHQIHVFECIQTAICSIANLIREENEKIAKTLPSIPSNGNESANTLPILNISSSTDAFLPKSSKLLEYFDVFLCGDAISDWTNEVLNRFLRKHDLSSWIGINPTNCLNDERIERSRILFFYISNTSRALEILILASYFVGLSKDVILCIENLNDDTTIENELLTKIGIKDYNRGRSYLKDVAERNNIPNFSCLDEAIDALGKELRVIH